MKFILLVLLSAISSFGATFFANPNFETNSRVLYPTNLIVHATPTGGSNSVAINTLLGDVKDIRSFMQGVTYAGTTNDVGPVINLAINAAANGSSVNNNNIQPAPSVFIPPGFYSLRTPIRAPNGLKLWSINSRATTISNAATSGDMIILDGTNTSSSVHHKLTVEGITLRGHPSATNGALIHAYDINGLQNTPWIEVNDVVFNNGFRGLVASNAVFLSVNGCDFVAQNDTGIYQEGSLNLFSIKDTRLIYAKTNAIYVRPGSGGALNISVEYCNNGLVFYNSGSGVVGHSWTMVGGFFERNTNNNIYIDDAMNVKLQFYGSTGGTNGIVVLGGDGVEIDSRFDSHGGFTLFTGQASNGTFPGVNTFKSIYPTVTANTWEGWVNLNNANLNRSWFWGNKSANLNFSATPYFESQGTNIVHQVGVTNRSEAIALSHNGSMGYIETIGAPLTLVAPTGSGIYTTNNVLWTASVAPVANTAPDLGGAGSLVYRYLWSLHNPLVRYTNITVTPATILDMHAGIMKLNGTTNGTVMTNFPSFTTNAANLGQYVVIMGSTNTVTLVDNGFLNGTRLNLPGTLTNVVLTNGVTIGFLFDTNVMTWNAIYYSEGSGGSSFPVSFVSTYATNSGINSATYFDGSGQLNSLAGVSSTELSYIGSLSSDAQTQIDSKQAAFTTGVGVTNQSNVLKHNVEAGANVTLSTNGSALVITAATSGGSGDDVYVNGSNITHPDFDDSSTAIWSVNNTNVTVYPTNLANAQIAAAAAIARSKIASGTADHIVINDGSGNLSSEATLGATRFPALTGDVTTSAGSLATTIAANSVALTTDTTGNYVADVAGTASEISVSHTPGEGSTATISLPAAIDLGGKTSFELPNGAAPTTSVFGQLAADNNAWATSYGAMQFFNGTSNTFIVGVDASDTPSNGQVPKWNTAGNITWENDSTGGGGGAVYINGVSVTDPNFTNSTEVTISTAATTNVSFTLSSTLDLGGKTSFEIPNAAAPTTDAFGEIAGDNNAWAASRGAVQFYDGTTNTYLVGALASDTPSNGQILKWNTNGTITWEDNTSTGYKVHTRLSVQSAKLPSSNPAVIDASGNHFKLLFDATTDESVSWSMSSPDHIGNAPVIVLNFTMASATTGNVVLGAQIYKPGSAEDFDVDGYDTAVTSTVVVPGTAGYWAQAIITLTSNDTIDSNSYWPYKVKVFRDADNVSDTATGDLELVSVDLYFNR